jgi:hypothetical protein
MKKLIAIIILCSSFALSGCDDKDAQEYAKTLITVLDSYQEQVDKKVTAEKESYKELAAVYERARERNIEGMLEEERVERSEKLATDMVTADHLPRSTEILASLHSYAAQDFTSTKDFLQVEADAQAQFLGDIEALEFESENLDNLRLALKTLSKPKDRLKRLRDAAVFAQDTKKEFDKLVCQDLDAGIKAQETKLDSMRADLALLSKEQQLLNDAGAAKDDARLEAVNNELNLKNAEIDALMKSIATLKEKKSKCS